MQKSYHVPDDFKSSNNALQQFRDIRNDTYEGAVDSQRDFAQSYGNYSPGRKSKKIFEPRVGGQVDYRKKTPVKSWVNASRSVNRMKQGLVGKSRDTMLSPNQNEGGNSSPIVRQRSLSPTSRLKAPTEISVQKLKTFTGAHTYTPSNNNLKVNSRGGSLNVVTEIADFEATEKAVGATPTEAKK